MKKNRKGLTFIEMMISIAILSFLLIASVTLFAAYTKNKTSIKKNEQAVEEMSLILNEIAKKLRMSNCVDGINSNWPGFAQNNKICHFGALHKSGTRIKIKSNTGGYIGYENGVGFVLNQLIFDSNGIYQSSTRISEHVRVTFYVTNGCYVSTNPCPVDQIGIPLITIVMTKLDNNNLPIPNATVQTSISQRSGYAL